MGGGGEYQVEKDATREAGRPGRFLVVDSLGVAIPTSLSLSCILCFVFVWGVLVRFSGEPETDE